MNMQEIQQLCTRQPHGLFWPNDDLIMKIERKFVSHIDFDLKQVVTTDGEEYFMNTAKSWSKLQVFQVIEQPRASNVFADPHYQIALNKLVNAQDAIAYMIMVDTIDYLRDNRGRYWPEDLVSWAKNRAQNFDSRNGIERVKAAIGP